ncbi:MAG: DNA polymerase IV [Planctomycetota bacterium]
MSTPSPSRDARLPAGTRRLLHLDVDAFLASVEQALHPELRGRPVVVGGAPTSRNLVMSCSYEARYRGVRPGMHLFEAARRLPDAVFRDGDAQAANRLRGEFVRVLLTVSPIVEVSSIDDFYVDLTGTLRLHGAAFDAAERLRGSLWDATGLPVTIGIGENRLLARLAGKLGKPGGIAELLPGHAAAFLHHLPVEALPGVGHAIGAHLARFQIRTVGELALVPRELLFASFGRDGLVLFERAHGRDDSQVVPTHALDDQDRLIEKPPRSLSRETTFEPEEGRPEIVEAMLSYLVERAAARLRALGCVARVVEVKLRYVDTRPRIEPGPRVNRTLARRRTLDEPSDATLELFAVARVLLRELPRRRALVKHIGLVLRDLRSAVGWQGRLFGEPSGELSGELSAERTLDLDRHRKLDHALDDLRARLGFGRVLRGSSAPLAASHPLGPDGFRLRTPSLNQ